MYYSTAGIAGVMLLTSKVEVAFSTNARPASDPHNYIHYRTCTALDARGCTEIQDELDVDNDQYPGNMRGLSTHHFHSDFNSLPQGGWSEWATVSGNLEWLWASPVTVTFNYYEHFPTHVKPKHTCSNDDGRFSTDNFPDSVRLSGFRLPTASELENFKPIHPPTCMARYVNNGAHWCDKYDYDTNAVVTLDEGCDSGCCDTLFVRPVGTLDVQTGVLQQGNGFAVSPCYGIGDSDGDGICNDADNCVHSPNPSQKYAFLELGAKCSDVIIQLDSNGTAKLEAYDLDNGAKDYCGVAAIASGRTDFDCTDIGTFVEFYSLEDRNGNHGSCVANITIVDLIAPDVSCKNLSLALDSNGVLHIDNPMVVNDGSYDACGIVSAHLSRSKFSCKDTHEPQPLVLSVMDNSGNVAFCEARVDVINEPPKWWNGLDSMTVLVGRERVSLFVDVSDPEGQPLSYEWEHTCTDDLVDVIFHSEPYSNNATIEFPRGSEPKVCHVVVEVCDICGSCLTDTSKIVVVDPKAGFITGAGWFVSPPGAYPKRPNSTGTVSYRFVAEYKQSHSVPTGDLQIFAREFDFYSLHYQWLVVMDDNCAELSGVGEVNLTGMHYEFSLFVCDGGEQRDTIVLKIWSTIDGNLLYDNDGGFSPVKGGNIQIHRAKTGMS